MNEINKDELLDIKKWQRLFFMVIYALAVNFVVVPVLLVLVVIQFLFYLFTSQINSQLQNANNWLQEFFNDSLSFLSFNSDAKPWPFNDTSEISGSSEEAELEGESEEVNTENEQPEQTTS